MATKTKTLYSKSSSTPSPPVVGQRCDNMIKDIWGTSNSSVIAVGSGVNRTYAERVITPLDTISNISPLSTVMALEPTSAIASGSGRGFDFNILTANKKYTFGVGFIQTRDNVFYVGASTSGGTGSYTKGAVLAKNTPRYYICKIIPSGQTEIYPNESGAYNLSFAKQESLNVLTSADLTKVRMLLGYTAAEGAERYSSTVGMFFRPFCYEGETWFDFFNVPWKQGGYYSCNVEYNDQTNLITSVGAVIPLGFLANNQSIEFISEPAKGGRIASSFNSSNNWKFSDGTFKKFANVNTTNYPYQSSINMSKYKQKDSSVTNIAAKGTRPILTLRYQEGGQVSSPSYNTIAAPITTYFWKANDGSIKAGKTSGVADYTIIPASVDAKRIIVLTTGGGSGGCSGHWSNEGSGGGGAATVGGVVDISSGTITVERGDISGAGEWDDGSLDQPANNPGRILRGGTLLATARGGGAHSRGSGGGGGTWSINNTTGFYNTFGVSGGGQGSGSSISFNNLSQERQTISSSGSSGGGRYGGACSFGNGGSSGSGKSSGSGGEYAGASITSGTPRGGGGGGGGGGGNAFGGNVGWGGKGAPGIMKIYY